MGILRNYVPLVSALPSQPSVLPTANANFLKKPPKIFTTFATHKTHCKMKTRVGILMGGYSSEAGISLQSGETVFKNLDRTIFEPYKVIISRESWHVEDGEARHPLLRNTFRFLKDGEEFGFDVVFNAIHGHPGEDGYIQALLELAGVPQSSCGFFESALTMNKHKTNALLKAQGVTVPASRFVLATDVVDEAELEKTFGYPLFIKPNRSGSSFGVTKVDKRAQIAPAIREAQKEDGQIIIEEAIIGTEVGCGVVHRNGKTEAIAVTEIVPKRAFFDYQAKYEGASEEITPARVAPAVYEQICRTSERIYDYLGLWGVVRIDYIIRDEQPYLIEVNSIPGLSPASIIPQQLAYRNWPLPEFFGGLLIDSIHKNKKS
jgi:D-alanine-D-alanine ligase